MDRQRRLVHGVALVVCGILPASVVGAVTLHTGAAIRPVPATVGVLAGLAGYGVARLTNVTSLGREGRPSRRALLGTVATALLGSVAGQAAVWLAPPSLLSVAVGAVGNAVLAGSLTLVGCGLALAVSGVALDRNATDS